jgi:hypothetical protein
MKFAAAPEAGTGRARQLVRLKRLATAPFVQFWTDGTFIPKHKGVTHRVLEVGFGSLRPAPRIAVNAKHKGSDTPAYLDCLQIPGVHRLPGGHPKSRSPCSLC